MSGIENVSRRRSSSGSLGRRASCSPRACCPTSVARPQAAAVPHRAPSRRRSTPASISASSPTARVFIVTHRSEMGTGIRTTLPLVAADELDADWSRVTIEQGIGDPRYGDQNTDGSRSIRDFYDAFRARRRDGAHDAGERGGGAVERAGGECTAQNHEVVHQAERPHARLRRAGAGGREAAGAEAARRCVQAEERVALRRQGHADLRPAATSSPARRSSASTCSARAWCTPRSSIRRCSAARCGASTTRRRERSAACSRR